MCYGKDKEKSKMSILMSIEWEGEFVFFSSCILFFLLKDH